MMILKINAKELIVEVDEILEDVDIEDIMEELPEATPRFIVLSYKWELELDRVSYPLIYLFYCPMGINPKLAMLYSSTKPVLSKLLDLNKEFDIRDKETFSREWLDGKMSFFKC